MNSRAVKRIDDVTRLRTAQFAEDSGALLLNSSFVHACTIAHIDLARPRGEQCSDTSVLQAPCHTPSAPTSTLRWCGRSVVFSVADVWTQLGTIATRCNALDNTLHHVGYAPDSAHAHHSVMFGGAL